MVNKAYLESGVLQDTPLIYDRLAVLEEVVESLQEAGSLLVDQDGNILLTSAVMWRGHLDNGKCKGGHLS